jgi:hypothetical protein
MTDELWPCPSCKEPGLDAKLYAINQKAFAGWGEVTHMRCLRCGVFIPTKAERQRDQERQATERRHGEGYQDPRPKGLHR